MRLGLLFLFVIGIYGYECPSGRQLPKPCNCSETDHGLIVGCDGSALTSIMKALATKTVDILTIKSCITEKTINVQRPVFIRNLTIQYCDLHGVLTSSWEAIGSRLRIMNLERNNITSIDFGRLTILNTLAIGHNNLTSLANTTFQFTSRLKVLNMHNASLNRFPSTSLKPLHAHLERLDLSGNSFDELPIIGLTPFIHLKTLDLSYNLITNVNLGGYWRMNGLVELHLNNNKITSLTKLSSKMVPKLKVINLRNNTITNVNKDFFEAVKTVETVDLSLNTMTEMPNISALSQLKSLNIDKNNINNLGEDVFAQNPSLNTVICSNNQLNHITEKTFVSAKNIKILMLNNNSISTIEKGAFGRMPHLEELGLSNNIHIQMENVTNAGLTQLVKLHMNNNKLYTLKKNDFASLIKLEWLDIRNSSLQGIENGTFSEKMGVILVSGNEFRCDDNFDWFFNHVVKNSVKTTANRAEKVACASGNRQLKLTFADKLGDATRAFLYSLFFQGDLEKDNSGCHILKGSLNWTNSWYVNLCGK